MTCLGWSLAAVLAIYSTGVTVGYVGLRRYLDSGQHCAGNPTRDRPGAGYGAS